jgi:hypothetical protein
MEQNRPEPKREVEERGGNRDALVEGNIVADERQLDPDSGVGADETGSDRVLSGTSAPAQGSGISRSGLDAQRREPGADATLMDGSVPADADLDLPSDAMNDPEQLEK